MNNKQRISFFRTTCNSNDDNKTATENTDNGLYEIPTNIKNVSHPDMRISREKLLLNNPKHRRTLITKLKKKTNKTNRRDK